MFFPEVFWPKVYWPENVTIAVRHHIKVALVRDNRIDVDIEAHSNG